MTDKPDDGGPAFPQFAPPMARMDPVTGHIENVPDGMSLRDWFAGQVLRGLLNNESNTKDAVMFAVDAYRFADAMLAARAKDKGKP